MVKRSVTHNVVIDEVKLIPEYKLPELYEYIHHFRLKVEKNKESIGQIMKFAGCWEEMPEDIFNDFLEEIGQRRKQAFTWRRNNETGTG